MIAPVAIPPVFCRRQKHLLANELWPSSSSCLPEHGDFEEDASFVDYIALGRII